MYSCHFGMSVILIAYKFINWVSPSVEYVFMLSWTWTDHKKNPSLYNKLALSMCIYIGRPLRGARVQQLFVEIQVVLLVRQLSSHLPWIHDQVLSQELQILGHDPTLGIKALESRRILESYTCWLPYCNDKLFLLDQSDCSTFCMMVFHWLKVWWHDVILTVVGQALSGVVWFLDLMIWGLMSECLHSGKSVS